MVSISRGEFVIRGIHSSDIRSLIEYRPTLDKPTRKIDYRNVPYRSGSLLFDEKAYNNTTLDLDCFFMADSEAERDALREYITYVFDTGTYIEFIPYFDPGRIYLVQATAPPSFKGHTDLGFNERYTVQLTVKPFKMYTSTESIELTYGGIVVNPSLYPSKPVFDILGSGDSTISINGRQFVIKNIQDHLTVNSAIPSSYYWVNGELTNGENKCYTRDYPYFDPGANTVTWSGTVDIAVQPRWWTL